MRISKLVPALLLALAAAAPAQVPNPSPAAGAAQDRGYDKETPKHAAVDAEEASRTRQLNATSALGAEVKSEATEAEQAAYQADLAAYQQQVSAARADAVNDMERFGRQQRAYADAMAQWRKQSAACEKGKMPACRLPTPNPADYY